MLPTDKTYTHLFFDLDHTLWDFDKASRESLIELYDSYQIERLTGAAIDRYLEVFYAVNTEFWNLYNHDRITKEEIRDTRFPLIFERLGVDPLTAPKQLGPDYLAITPTKPYLIAHALEALEYLSSRYQLHIITNGFDQTQATKLSSAQIDRFFLTVTTSETTGHKKPSPVIFQHALKVAQAQLADSLMIGDNLNTDVAGALQIGMDALYFSNGQEVKEDIPHITCLSQLRKVL